MPPTVAGPTIVTSRASASLMMRRVYCSGTPSAMMATVRSCSLCSSASSVDGSTERKEAKFTITLTSSCAASASDSCRYTGTSSSSVPQ